MKRAATGLHRGLKYVIMRHNLNPLDRKRDRLKKPVRTLLILAGTLCVILALIGILLPILPTTPFLLLAAVCYARSSDRFYDWLMNNAIFGTYIRNYREGRGIPLKQKVITIGLLWLSIGYAAWQVAPQWWLKLVLVGIAAGVTLHLVRTKTWRPEGETLPLARELDLPEDPA